MMCTNSWIFQIKCFCHTDINPHFFWSISAQNTQRCSHVLSYWLHDTCQGQTEWYIDGWCDAWLAIWYPISAPSILEVSSNVTIVNKKAGNEKSTRTINWYSTIMGSHLSAKHICQHTRIHNRHLILDPILPPLILAFCRFYRSSDPAPFLKVLRRPNMLAANTSAGSL